jgi:hypothetical protein
VTKHETIVAGNDGLAKLREPFPAHHISKLPKPTKAQTEAVKANFTKGMRCKECGSWHHPDVVHLDYVGHAAATDRLLDTDLEWTWEPLAVDDRGLPAFDNNGGLWIKLTVCGVTRLGYGSADGKSGGDAKKEIIGDAIRNAGMRFGMALDLWHKGDLHVDEADETAATPATVNPEQELMLEDKMREAGVDKAKFLARAGAKLTKEVPAEKFPAMMKDLNGRIAKANQVQAQGPQADDDLADSIPY